MPYDLLRLSRCSSVCPLDEGLSIPQQRNRDSGLRPHYPIVHDVQADVFDDTEHDLSFGGRLTFKRLPNRLRPLCSPTIEANIITNTIIDLVEPRFCSLHHQLDTKYTRYAEYSILVCIRTMISFVPNLSNLFSLLCLFILFFLYAVVLYCSVHSLESTSMRSSPATHSTHSSRFLETLFECSP